MLISREFINYISRKLVSKLSPHVFEVHDIDGSVEVIAAVIAEDLSIEDRLNDEVRDILSQYSEYMRRESVSYQEMFRKINNK